MEKSKFLGLLKKTLLLKKLDQKDKLNLDSLNLLQLVEFNSKYFKKEKIDLEKVANCKSVKEILRLYKIS